MVLGTISAVIGTILILLGIVIGADNAIQEAAMMLVILTGAVCFLGGAMLRELSEIKNTTRSTLYKIRNSLTNINDNMTDLCKNLRSTNSTSNGGSEPKQ